MIGLSGVALLSACGGGGGDSLLGYAPARQPRIMRYDGPPITQLQIFKAKRKLYLISGTTVIKTYDISLGGNPIGPKQFEGDGKTPEGAYRIDRRNWNSAYHLSLGISYPDTDDVARAEAAGRKPGGDIFIHGREGKNKGLGRDWTAGCIAVSDDEIEEIFAMVQDGTVIFLFP
jgi:murein L,D-transpeptidase YafK